MKKILLTSVLLFFGLHIFAQEKEETYTSELGKFSMISFGEVTEDVKNGKASITYRAAYRHKEMLFALSSSLEQNKPQKASDLLNASILNFKTALKGTVVEQKKIKENNVNGISAVFNINNGVMVEYKVFYKDLYLYQVMVFAKKENYKKEVAETFFKSFVITK